MAGNLPRRRKEKTKIGGFGFRWGSRGGQAVGCSSSFADLCLLLMVKGKLCVCGGAVPLPWSACVSHRVPDQRRG